MDQSEFQIQHTHDSTRNKSVYYALFSLLRRYWRSDNPKLPSRTKTDRPDSESKHQKRRTSRNVVLKDIWAVSKYHMNCSFNLLECTDVSFAF